MSRLPPLALAAPILLLSGCVEFGYYAQSVRGQLDIWRRCRPIPQVLEAADSPAELKERLSRVLAVRDFATRELGLPDNGSYLEYADLGRPYVLWNVYAAPEFSTELKTWCFPVAGCVGYRGYFSREGAEALADRLRAQGYDVYLGGVSAYSTLGWFDDPVLNTFLFDSETRVARYLFHELAHQVAYADDDTEFNESFATAVAREGLRRWYEATRQGEPTELEAIEARREQFVALVLDCRNRLAALYEATGTDPERRHGKAAILRDLQDRYAQLRDRWGGYSGYDRWFAQGPNNAQLASVAAYTSLVPEFLALLDAEGGNLESFYVRVQELAELPKVERRARLAAVSASAARGFSPPSG